MVLLKSCIHFANNWGNINTVKYFLLQNDFYGKIVYGFKLELFNSKHILKESEEVLNVTDDLNFAKAIFKALVNLNVTPMSLVNILDDLLSSQENS